MTALENRMILLETSNIMRHREEETVNNTILYEEYDLPLQNMQALERLEQLLKTSSFADKMVNTLKQVGGVNLSNIIPNMLKKLLSDHFAQTFSYLGQRNKKNFSALKLCSIVKSEYYMKLKQSILPYSKQQNIDETILIHKLFLKYLSYRIEYF
ncbi:uncharacterized protein LOC114928065 [Nylanderia fulva]|uniref:uncharacterized protein LOC114928065 n=1 Tax=Nylanderia fulva TaxID=613905 RepID=UPI0010FB75BB|nr:uncharacterized protein LOC114928065 [Nylanderia fulva]